MSTVAPPSYPPPPGPPGGPPGIPPPARSGGGCWRVGLIGCGVAGLALLLLIVGSILYIRRNPEAIADFVMTQVESHFASDVTDQDKADLRAAYASYRRKLKTGKASAEPLQRVRTVFMTGGSRNEISRDQVHDMTAAFRDAAGDAPLRSPDARSLPGPVATPVLEPPRSNSPIRTPAVPSPAVSPAS